MKNKMIRIVLACLFFSLLSTQDAPTATPQNNPNAPQDGGANPDNNAETPSDNANDQTETATDGENNPTTGTTVLPQTVSANFTLIRELKEKHCNGKVLNTAFVMTLSRDQHYTSNQNMLESYATATIGFFMGSGGAQHIIGLIVPMLVPFIFIAAAIATIVIFIMYMCPGYFLTRKEYITLLKQRLFFYMTILFIILLAVVFVLFSNALRDSIKNAQYSMCFYYFTQYDLMAGLNETDYTFIGFDNIEKTSNIFNDEIKNFNSLSDQFTKIQTFDFEAKKQVPIDSALNFSKSYMTSEIVAYDEEEESKELPIPIDSLTNYINDNVNDEFISIRYVSSNIIDMVDYGKKIIKEYGDANEILISSLINAVNFISDKFKHLLDKLLEYDEPLETLIRYMEITDIILLLLGLAVFCFLPVFIVFYILRNTSDKFVWMVNTAKSIQLIISGLAFLFALILFLFMVINLLVSGICFFTNELNTNADFINTYKDSLNITDENIQLVINNCFDKEKANFNVFFNQNNKSTNSSINDTLHENVNTNPKRPVEQSDTTTGGTTGVTGDTTGETGGTGGTGGTTGGTDGTTGGTGDTTGGNTNDGGTGGNPDITVGTGLLNRETVTLHGQTTDGNTPPTDGSTPPTDGSTPPTDGSTPPKDDSTQPTDGSTTPGEEEQKEEVINLPTVPEGFDINLLSDFQSFVTSYFVYYNFYTESITKQSPSIESFTRYLEDFRDGVEPNFSSYELALTQLNDLISCSSIEVKLNLRKCSAAENMECISVNQRTTEDMAVQFDEQDCIPDKSTAIEIYQRLKNSLESGKVLYNAMLIDAEQMPKLSGWDTPGYAAEVARAAIIDIEPHMSVIQNTLKNSFAIIESYGGDLSSLTNCYIAKRQLMLIEAPICFMLKPSLFRALFFLIVINLLLLLILWGICCSIKYSGNLTMGSWVSKTTMASAWDKSKGNVLSFYENSEIVVDDESDIASDEDGDSYFDDSSSDDSGNG